MPPLRARSRSGSAPSRTRVEYWAHTAHYSPHSLRRVARPKRQRTTPQATRAPESPVASVIAFGSTGSVASHSVNPTAAQSASLWTTNLIITLSLLSIINAIGAGPTMWIYGAFNVAAWVFVFLRLPELTGKSLEQIEGRLRAGRFRPRDFRKVSTDSPYPSTADSTEDAAARV